MNPRTSHKDFILMLGVVVALLVIFLLWFSQMPSQSTDLENAKVIPQIISPLKEGFLKKAWVDLSRVLDSGCWITGY